MGFQLYVQKTQDLIVIPWENSAALFSGAIWYHSLFAIYLCRNLLRAAQHGTVSSTVGSGHHLGDVLQLDTKLLQDLSIHFGSGML